MEGKPNDAVLYVYMLGSFRMVYKNRQIMLGKSQYNKMQQLLLYLIYNRSEGVHREQLLDLIYADVDTEQASNALRAAIHRLRRKLVESGLPEGEYVTNTDSLYRWNSEHLPLILDVEEFEKKAEEALRMKNEEGGRALLEQACHYYTGEFLPSMIGDTWVAAANRRYQNLYFQCLRALVPILKVEDEYEKLLSYCDRTLAWYPYEEWQLVKLECLAALKNYKQAVTYYKQIEHEYQREFGSMPTEKITSCYRKVRKQMRNEMNRIEDIQVYLEPDLNQAGATRYDYMTFIDIYRYVLWILKRKEDEACLAMFTLVDENGVPIEAPELLEQCGTDLEHAICSNVRKSDLYTRFGKNQFLLLLVGADEEKCEKILERVHNGYRKITRRRKVDIYYVCQSVTGMPKGNVPENLRMTNISQLDEIYRPEDTEQRRRRTDEAEDL
jgi:DNA-binding SARP family transcriptional activator